ncbi:MAG: YbaK/EbsC family protein [Oscillospiraceae bacterium]|jgi:prolyl-tRNA editing enzyme YbaK/EbsC (Cys-tRNA(Pro) deacylase)|nr:YbaK/EbsC family protein [Oscillospiraceae bacterium]
MSIEKARAHLRSCGVEDRVREFDVSSATVELAAQALGVVPERIAKTLSFKSGAGCLLVVAAGDARVDNHRFRDQFGFKAKMLTADEAVSLVGHAVGGVCPFGINAGVAVYIDSSVRRFRTVFPAAGSARSAVEMTPEELYRYSGALEWVDVCKLPEPV